MKQKLALVLALVGLATAAFSQTGDSKYSGSKKGSLVGIHFNLSDYNAPSGIKDPLTGRVYQKIKDMNKGFSLSYWKGLNSRIDFSGKVNVLFKEFGAATSQTGSRSAGIELEPMVHLRPYGDNSLIAPFLSVGVGAGYYYEDFGAYVPAGLGFQVNFKSNSYIIVQALYRWTLTDDVYPDNLFYSFGVAQNIGKEKAAPVEIPIPIVEPPKDRDGDGVLDVDDKCPDTPGVAALQGCPDRDGDGIADADDKCPDVKGLARYQGCPIPDTDKDGINDEEDKCPTVPGVARYQGCPIPDTDGDGVNDEEDKCINEAGPASNFGCPVIKEEVIQRVNAAAKNIFFATGSSKLLPKSFKSLDDVVKALKDNPTYNVSIDGYTDNTGTVEKNQILSEQRAGSVKTYLVSKGVSESSVTSTGHGIDNPVADNKTAAGRARNRRTEMTVRNF